MSRPQHTLTQFTDLQVLHARAGHKSGRGPPQATSAGCIMAAGSAKTDSCMHIFHSRRLLAPAARM